MIRCSRLEAKIHAEDEGCKIGTQIERNNWRFASMISDGYVFLLAFLGLVAVAVVVALARIRWRSKQESSKVRVFWSMGYRYRSVMPVALEESRACLCN